MVARVASELAAKRHALATEAGRWKVGEELHVMQLVQLFYF